MLSKKDETYCSEKYAKHRRLLALKTEIEGLLYNYRPVSPKIFEEYNTLAEELNIKEAVVRPLKENK